MPIIIDVAGIDGKSDMMAVNMRDELAVVVNPVELLAEYTLTGVSKVGHLRKIDKFMYAQIKNHCLDEGSLKIFCYFCSVIEGFLGDFGELVKRLSIHNVTLFLDNCQVARN